MSPLGGPRQPALSYDRHPADRAVAPAVSRRLALALFVIGWIFQFVGHAFEGKPPEFFHDWRFLFVGLRWWVAKICGHA